MPRFCLVAVCLLFGATLGAQEEDDAEKKAVYAANRMTGEQLAAALPPAKPLAEELTLPCPDGPRMQTESREVQERLYSKAVYTIAVVEWGLKWVPSRLARVEKAPEGCTDYVFVTKQFQRALGHPETGTWSAADVDALISALDPVIAGLNESGRLKPQMLQPVKPRQPAGPEEYASPIVRACVDRKGALTEATIAESSGSAQLDEAALKIARSGKYQAGGKKGPNCFNFRVRFELHD